MPPRSPLNGLRSDLDELLRPYLYCCGYTQTFGHLRTYCRGLLSDLERKTAEPIALASGCAVRTLQEFLRDHRWQHTQVRAQLQRHVGVELVGLPDDGLGTVGLIDETSALKSGDKTPGVQRQYLGCVGKIDNGIVTVHLGVCIRAPRISAITARRAEGGPPVAVVASPTPREKTLTQNRSRWNVPSVRLDAAITAVSAPREPTNNGG